MKDFYDIAVLAGRFEFDGDLLVRAIQATFEHRGTPLPEGLPVALTPAFTADSAKRTQWTAFMRKADADDIGLLEAVAAAIRAFIEAPAGGSNPLAPTQPNT